MKLTLQITFLKPMSAKKSNSVSSRCHKVLMPWINATPLKHGVCSGICICWKLKTPVEYRTAALRI